MGVTDATAREQENKYGYLLQPIRDMTKNWNIDIAHELEDFLEELSSIQISFDGGKTTMNFAEAAMLIQGSACVYSKKVDYLYKLNYEVMELIMSRKKGQQSGGGDGGAENDDNNLRDKDDDDFLTLDDCEPGKNTTMRIDDMTLIVTANDIPRTPKILVKVSDTEKNDFNTLVNRKGEVIANSSDFKMNTSLIHPSGCMLLDASHIELFQLALEHMKALAAQKAVCEQAENVVVGTAGAGDAELTDVNNHPVPMPEDILAADAMEHEPAHNDDDNGADVIDDVMDLPDEVDLDLGPEGEGQQMEEAGVERMALRERSARRPPQPPPPPPRDYWQTMDPHTTEGCPVKSFVKAKKSKILIKDKKSNDPPPFVDELCGEGFYSHSLKKPSNPKKVPKLAAFESLFWKHFKQRKLIMRRKAMEARRVGQEPEPDQPGDEDDDDVIPGGEDDQQVHVDAGGFEDNNDDDDLAAPAVDYDQALEEGQHFHPVNREMNFSMLGTQDPSTGGSTPQTYEDLVRAYVDSYMSSVQEYALVTDLSKRVSEWEDKILPRMDEEDAREPFDIHVYGSRILDALTNKNDVKPFKEVARVQDSFQVSRLFAATLQLANQYNVEITCSGDLDRGMDSMALKLLSTKRHHEELEEYRAPSFQ